MKPSSFIVRCVPGAWLPAAVLLLAACVLPGCTSWWYGSGGPLTATSASGAATFAPGAGTAVYKPIDDNSADVYLTDLPMERLADSRDTLADLSGTIVHVHLFLVPTAGSTPVDSTACNAAARLAVFANGAAGIYSGGGFVFPTTIPGEGDYSGQIRNASLRLVHATADFADKLGPTVLVGGMIAKRDEAAAAVIAGRLANVAQRLPVRAAATRE